MATFLDPRLFLPQWNTQPTEDAGPDVPLAREKRQAQIGPPARSPLMGGLAGLLELINSTVDRATVPGGHTPMLGKLWKLLGGPQATEGAANLSEGKPWFTPAGGALNPDSLPLPTKSAIDLGLAAAPLLPPVIKGLAGAAPAALVRPTLAGKSIADYKAALAEYEQAVRAQAPVSFTTEKGSRYYVQPDQTLLRDKYSGVRGLTSDWVRYLDPADAETLLAARQSNPESAFRLDLRGNGAHLSHRPLDAPESSFEALASVPVQTRPQVGLVPLDAANGNPHVGHAITEIAPPTLRPGAGTLRAGFADPSLAAVAAREPQYWLRKGPSGELSLRPEMYAQSFGIYRGELGDGFGRGYMVPRLERVNPPNYPMTIFNRDAYVPRADELLGVSPDQTKQVSLLPEHWDPREAAARRLQDKFGVQLPNRGVKLEGSTGVLTKSPDIMAGLAGKPFFMTDETVNLGSGTHDRLILDSPYFPDWPQYERSPRGAGLLGPYGATYPTTASRDWEESAFRLVEQMRKGGFDIPANTRGAYAQLAQLAKDYAKLPLSPEMDKVRELLGQFRRLPSDYGEAKSWGAIPINRETMAGYVGSGFLEPEVRRALEEGLASRGIPYELNAGGRADALEAASEFQRYAGRKPGVSLATGLAQKPPPVAKAVPPVLAPTQSAAPEYEALAQKHGFTNWSQMGGQWIDDAAHFQVGDVDQLLENLQQLVPHQLTPTHAAQLQQKIDMYKDMSDVMNGKTLAPAAKSPTGSWLEDLYKKPIADFSSPDVPDKLLKYAKQGDKLGLYNYLTGVDGFTPAEIDAVLVKHGVKLPEPDLVAQDPAKVIPVLKKYWSFTPDQWTKISDGLATLPPGADYTELGKILAKATDPVSSFSMLVDLKNGGVLAPKPPASLSTGLAAPSPWSAAYASASLPAGGPLEQKLAALVGESASAADYLAKAQEKFGYSPTSIKLQALADNLEKAGLFGPKASATLNNIPGLALSGKEWAKLGEKWDVDSNGVMSDLAMLQKKQGGDPLKTLTQTYLEHPGGLTPEGQKELNFLLDLHTKLGLPHPGTP